MSLDRLHRRAMKKGRRLASLSADQRHRARIALKKCRYAAEFFASLFNSGARAYVRRAASIQDRLGASNDFEMAERLLQDLGGAAQRGSAWQLASRLLAQNRDEENDWKAAEKELRKLKPFWK
jgi:CHAD domain-containing protein